MIRSHFAAMVPATVLAVLMTLSAQAADNAFQVIPEDVLQVVVMQRLDQLDAKMQNLGRLLKVPVAPLLDLFQAGTGIGDAFDSRGSAILLVVPGEGEAAQPAIVLLLPVTDYQQVLQRLQPEKPTEKIVEVRFRDHEGKPGPRLSAPMRPWLPGREALMGNRGHYAVFTEPRHRAALEKVLDAKCSIAAGLAQWEPWLAENDVVAITTARGIKVFSGMAGKHNWISATRSP